MNSVISAATIEARNSGWDVLGIMDGFEHLIEGRIEEARPLSITDVSRIHAQGGSIIRTSRANPTVRDEGAADPDWRLHACLESLRKLRIDALVTIGGDDTAFSASRLAGAAEGGLRVAHVPKTIDNDLPLPGGTPTFGYETARSVGVQLVSNLMTDAITTQRWYLVVAMGRSAGHLALGIGKSAGATLTIIAEEFPRDAPLPLTRLVDVLETSMLKRIAYGRPFGVAVLAEGIGLRLSQEDLERAMPEIERDEHGHVRLAQLELDRLLAKLVRDRFRERGQRITVEGKNIGYELRCAPPIPFDVEYTRDLGYAAVDYLKQVQELDQRGGMITIQEGLMVALPFGSFNDPVTGRVRIRHVNVDSSSYRVAREYMIRLDREDLEDPERLRPIAVASGLSPEAFRDRYGYLVSALGKTAVQGPRLAAGADGPAVDHRSVGDGEQFAGQVDHAAHVVGHDADQVADRQPRRQAADDRVLLAQHGHRRLGCLQDQAMAGQPGRPVA
jgi:ATP-dependent phosphofructokinase / diphosphate-dependent phosphofructokinase